MLYPIGIIISLLLNTHYFTSCLFLFTPGIIHRKIKITEVLKFQIICLVGNIFGVLIFTWIVGYWTVNLDEEGIDKLIATGAENRSLFFYLFMIIYSGIRIWHAIY